MIKRHALKILKELSKMFSSVIVTGSRQVRKVTLLQEYGKKYEYLSFDDPLLIDEFNENGKNFLENYSLPLILDEVQYVPNVNEINKAEYATLKCISKALGCYVEDIV